VTKTTRSRSTRQKTAIIAALVEADQFCSAQNLHARLQGYGERVGLTTVYRCLQGLTETGELDAIVASDGRTLYGRCGQGAGHHHHLICRQCGASKPVMAAAVESWCAHLATQHGFTEVTHSFEVFGICPQCSMPTAAAT
jgi:Fur family ferric uptake transcriptional regulator